MVQVRVKESKATSKEFYLMLNGGRMSDHSQISRLKNASEEAHYTHKAMIADQERTEDLNRICAAFRNACGKPFEADDIATICHCFSGFLHEAGFQELSDHLIDLGDEVKPEDKK